jgi:hypothetical protein
MTAPVLPPVGPNWQTWARQLNAYLGRQLNRLLFKTTDDNPSENGVILWDEANGYPVVSKGGEFRQIVLSDGHGEGAITTTQTAAATNTAYALTYTFSENDGLTLSGSQIQFDEGGHYLVSFSAQIASSSASTVNFWFWPRINGTDVTNASMKNALHQNAATLVVSRSAILSVSAGDYLEAMWAVDSTSGTLSAVAATAFAPAAPASTISILRVHA